MAERIASAEVYVGLKDDTSAGLAKVRSEFERTKDKVARMRAEAKFGADTSELERKLAEAKAELKAFDKERKNLAKSQDADDKRELRNLDRKIKRRQDNIAKISDEVAERKKALKAAKEERKFAEQEE